MKINFRIFGFRFLVVDNLWQVYKWTVIGIFSFQLIQINLEFLVAIWRYVARVSCLFTFLKSGSCLLTFLKCGSCLLTFLKVTADCWHFWNVTAVCWHFCLCLLTISGNQKCQSGISGFVTRFTFFFLYLNSQICLLCIFQPFSSHYEPFGNE